MKQPLLDPVTARNLEVSSVLSALGALAASEPGRERALALKVHRERGSLERTRGLVAEMMKLLDGSTGQGPRLPARLDLGFLGDLDTLFSRLERGGVLEGEELRAVVALVAPTLSLTKLVSVHGSELPNIEALIEQGGLGSEQRSSALKRIAAELDACLDEDGVVKDSASRELKKTRRRASELRTRLSARARKLLEKFSDHLQDDFTTQREDRYVLPVRSDSRTGVPGIIHGSSNSGATLFIEPHVLVDDMNELKVLEGEVLALQRKILADLSTMVGAQVGTLRRAQELLVTVDLIMAMARFGHRTSGTLPELSDGPELDLRSVRHPMLVLAGAEVVPNDVAIAASMGWVVSGPNAGGKTVLIKTVGLCVVMTYLGLPVPAAPGSRVGRFDRVRAEIGDAQSIESNLSTFSAQVGSLGRMLETIGPASLVILDELAAGTDPDEGAVLAEAIIDELLDRGAAVLVATHFETLKRRSIVSERLVAAGMGLSMETLEPTYELHVGMPGSSGGLLVAERYGLPKAVIQRARQILEHGQGPDEEGRLQALERLDQELRAKLEEAEKLETELRSKAIKIEKKEQQLSDQNKRSLVAQQRFLTTELTVLRSELKHAHKVLRRRPLKKEAVGSTEKVASKVGRTLAPDGPLSTAVNPPRPTLPLGDKPLEPGDEVVVASMQLEGTVEKVDGQKVRILVGGKTWTVEISRVARPTPGHAKKTGEKMQDEHKPDGGDEQDGEYQSSYNTLDLRGRGLDEAQMDLDQYLDDALEMGMQYVFVIHGHGSGILKNGLRRYMRHLKKVQSFRPGKHGEGGDGVTVCKLETD